MKRNSPRHGQFYLEATGRRCFRRVNGSALTIWVWLSRWWLEVKKVKQEYQRCLGGSGWKLIIHCQPKKVSKLHVVFQHKPLQIWVQLFPWVFVVCVHNFQEALFSWTVPGRNVSDHHLPMHDAGGLDGRLLAFRHGVWGTSPWWKWNAINGFGACKDDSFI